MKKPLELWSCDPRDTTLKCSQLVLTSLRKEIESLSKPFENYYTSLVSELSVFLQIQIVEWDANPNFVRC